MKKIIATFVFAAFALCGNAFATNLKKPKAIFEAAQAAFPEAVEHQGNGFTQEIAVKKLSCSTNQDEDECVVETDDGKTLRLKGDSEEGSEKASRKIRALMSALKKGGAPIKTEHKEADGLGVTSVELKEFDCARIEPKSAKKPKFECSYEKEEKQADDSRNQKELSLEEKKALLLKAAGAKKIIGGSAKMVAATLRQMASDPNEVRKAFFECDMFNPLLDNGQRMQFLDCSVRSMRKAGLIELSFSTDGWEVDSAKVKDLTYNFCKQDEIGYMDHADGGVGHFCQSKTEGTEESAGTSGTNLAE